MACGLPGTSRNRTRHHLHRAERDFTFAGFSDCIQRELYVVDHALVVSWGADGLAPEWGNGVIAASKTKEQHLERVRGLL